MEGGHAIGEIPDAQLTTPILTVGRGIILATLLFGEFMIMLDSTVVNVAIPQLTSDLHASLDQVLWVLNAYILTFAMLLITGGRLGEMFGPRKLFLGGMALFTASSAACAVANDINQLIIFRVLQAVGAALLTPQPGTILTYVFPPEKRGAALGAMGGVIGLAAATGPTLGGILTSAFSWRAIFIPNVPIGILSIALTLLVAPELRVHQRQRLDVLGIVLASLALFCGIFGLIEGQKYGWGRIVDTGSFNIGAVHAGLVSIPLMLFLSVAFLALFIVWEARQQEPLLPLSLFRDRNFSIGSLVMTLVTFNSLALTVLLLLFLQSVRGLTALQAGIAIMPQAVALLIMAPISGRLVTRPFGRFLPVVGLLLFTVGMGLVMVSLAPTATGLTFTLPLVLMGMGVGLNVASGVTLALAFVAPAAVGTATGFLNTMRQLGSSLATAIVTGAVFESVLSTQLHTQAVRLAPQLHGLHAAQVRASFIRAFANAGSHGLQVGRGQSGASFRSLAPLSPDAARQLQHLSSLVFQSAFINSLKPALLVPMVVAFLGAGVALLLRRLPAAPPPSAAISPAAGAAAPQPVILNTGVAMGTTGLADTIALNLPIPRTLGTQSGPRLRPPYLSVSNASPHSEYVVTNGTRLGRAPRNAIVLDDPMVSREHAEVSVQNGRAVIRDLGSANGTRVNGVQITGLQPIHDGDTISLGSTTLTFHNDLELACPRLVADALGRTEYGIRGLVTIGRIRDNDIVIRDSRVSRRHAEVRIENSRVVLRDLASLNGTKVNGLLIARDQPLHNSDVIQIGDASFVYHDNLETRGPSVPLTRTDGNHSPA